MTESKSYSFTRYLAAKKSVDDRALNRHVWQSLSASLPPTSPGKPLRLLEIGAGIGTMLERMMALELFSSAEYTGIDSRAENITVARQRLPAWGAENGYQVSRTDSELLLFSRKGRQVKAAVEAVDVFEFAARRQHHNAFDLLLANAFLDVVDVPATLPSLLVLLKPGGLVYFTINFDGATIFEPVIDAELEERIQHLYHRSMDERLVAGKPSGDSRIGRHLFGHLSAAGVRIVDAGSSDWVVFAGSKGYPYDEAFFLHFIIETIYRELQNHPEIEPSIFKEWAHQRHDQIERGELAYIAHQLDFLGRIGPS
ncbi:MAG TPA: class I SAM-dependent methyltransferase [Anaerolineales bacterium]|nr:class I SAM-dependent methyltransferase [Anaerolineales bacterium]